MAGGGSECSTGARREAGEGEAWLEGERGGAQGRAIAKVKREVEEGRLSLQQVGKLQTELKVSQQRSVVGRKGRRKVVQVRGKSQPIGRKEGGREGGREEGIVEGGRSWRRREGGSWRRREGV